jgi:hypothetical protein
VTSSGDDLIEPHPLMPDRDAAVLLHRRAVVVAIGVEADIN